MALLVPNEGEAQMLNLILGKVASENLTLKLYTNNYTPTETDTSASYTECALTGYAAKTLTSAGWTVTAGTGSPGNSIAAYSAQTFSITATGTVYGYYIVGATSGKVYFAELFSTAATLPSGGGSITVTPQLQLE